MSASCFHSYWKPGCNIIDFEISMNIHRFLLKRLEKNAQKSHEPILLLTKISYDPVVSQAKKSHEYPVVSPTKKSHDPVAFCPARSCHQFWPPPNGLFNSDNFHGNITTISVFETFFFLELDKKNGGNI